jgi:nucleolar protein 14
LVSETLQSIVELADSSIKQNVSLQLQRHKPVAIKTVLPKFQENYSLDKHYDPDRDRAEMRKLQSQLKKETKGAIRELRKDAQFLAREKLAEIKQSDKAYQAKVKSIMGELSRTEGSEDKFVREQKKK